MSCSNQEMTSRKNKSSSTDETLEETDFFRTNAQVPRNSVIYDMVVRTPSKGVYHDPDDNDGLVIPTTSILNTPESTATYKTTSETAVFSYPKSSPYYKSENPVKCSETRAIVMPCMTTSQKSSPPLFSPDEEDFNTTTSSSSSSSEDLSSFTKTFFDSARYMASKDI